MFDFHGTDMDFQSDSYENRGVGPRALSSSCDRFKKKHFWDHSAMPISILNWKSDVRPKNRKYFLTSKVCLSATETDF